MNSVALPTVDHLADNGYLRALAVVTTIVAGCLAIYYLHFQLELTKLNLAEAQRKHAALIVAI